jgi:hypothetical protein
MRSIKVNINFSGDRDQLEKLDNQLVAVDRDVSVITRMKLLSLSRFT